MSKVLDGSDIFKNTHQEEIYDMDNFEEQHIELDFCKYNIFSNNFG